MIVEEHEHGADWIAIAQTITNHQEAIYTLAAQVEGLEVRWNDVREYYS
jgi:hypothetical protein